MGFSLREYAKAKQAAAPMIAIAASAMCGMYGDSSCMMLCIC